MSMIFRPKPPPKKYEELYNKIKERGLRLDALCNVYRGIWTGILHVFVVTRDVVEKYGIEEGALRPILRGKDIGPFRYKWAERWIIYTKQENFPEKYPNTMKYLEKWKRVLERRGAVWIYGRRWWELEDPLDPKMFEVEKIMSPYISRINAFAWEEGKHYALDSTAIIRFWFNQSEAYDYFSKWKETNEPELNVESIVEEGFSSLKVIGSGRRGLFYLTGILNSEVIEFFYKLYAPRVTKRGTRVPRGRFFLYVPPYLNVLPIAIASDGERNSLLSIVEKLTQKSMKYAELEEESEEKSALEEEIMALTAELNELVYDVYGLSEEERAKIQLFVVRKR